MPDQLTPAQIKAAQSRGAESTVKPQSVEITNAESFFAHMHKMAHEMSQVQKNSQAAMLSAIQRLTETIREKKMDGTDVSQLIAAVQALKTETVAHQEPVAYRLTGKRNTRGFIDIESGLIFTPIERNDS